MRNMRGAVLWVLDYATDADDATTHGSAASLRQAGHRRHPSTTTLPLHSPELKHPRRAAWPLLRRRSRKLASNVSTSSDLNTNVGVYRRGTVCYAKRRVVERGTRMSFIGHVAF